MELLDSSFKNRLAFPRFARDLILTKSAIKNRGKAKKMFHSIIVLLMMNLVSNAFGQGTLGRWEMCGLSGTPTVVSPSGVVSNVTFSNLSRGAGVNGASATNGFSSNNWSTSSTLSTSNNDYYEFTITPNSGYVITITTLKIRDQVSTTNSSFDAYLRYSEDGYSSNLSQWQPSTANSNRTINLSGLTALLNRSTPVTFRIYGSDADATSTTYTINCQGTSAGNFRGVDVDGSVTAIPANPANPTSNSPQCVGVGVTLTRSGTPPAGETWYWQNSSTGTTTSSSGSTFNVTSSGTYYIRARNNTSLAWSAGAGSLSVVVNPSPQVSGFLGNTICNGGTGQLTVNTSSGVGPFSVVINGSTYDEVVSGTPFNVSSTPSSTTNYTLTSITDANGCTRTNFFTDASASITVNQPPSTLSYSSPSPSYCIGIPITNNTPSVSGTTPITYSVSPALPAGLSLNASTGVISGTPTAITVGDYKVTATNSFCTSSTDVTLHIAVTSNSLVTVPASRCGTGTVSLSATPAGCFASTVGWYAANTGGSSLQTGPTFTTPSISNTTTYYAQENLTGGLTTMGTTTTNSTNRGLVFDLDEPIVLNSVQIQSSSSASIVIGLRNIVGATIGISDVTITTNSNLQTVPLNWSIPKGTGYRILLITNNSNVNLRRTENFTSWPSFGIGAITGNFDSNGNNRYNYFYNWNISRARVPVVATVNLPEVTITPSGSTYICDGGHVELTASAGSSWEWSTGETTQSIVVNDSGNFSVTISDAGCSGTSAVTTVTKNSIPIQPSEISGLTTICQGSTQTYSVSETNVPGVFYTWELPQGWTGTSTTNSITVIVGPTSGEIKVTPSTHGCGNGLSRTLAVTVDPLPAAAGVISGSADVCKGDVGVAYSIDEISESTGYSWSYTGIAKVNSTNSKDITIDFDADSTSGVLTVKGTNDCGEGISKSLSITVHTPPIINTQPKDQAVCETGTATFTVVAHEVGDVSYQWQEAIDGSTEFVNINDSDVYSGATTATLILNNPPASMNLNRYICIVQGVCKDPTISAEATLKVTNKIAGNIGTTFQTVCKGTAPVVLIGATPTGGNGEYSYRWQISTKNGTDDDGFTDIVDATLKDYAPGALSVTTWYRRIVTSGDCSDTSPAVQITVKECTESIKFDESNSWEVPCNVTEITIQAYGGGGAGGGALPGVGTSGRGGGGGGGGAYAISTLQVTPGDKLNINVARPVLGVIGGNGNNGEDSYVTSVEPSTNSTITLIKATGGEGGKANTVEGTTASGGLGGFQGSIGQDIRPGAAGGNGTATSGTANPSAASGAGGTGANDGSTGSVGGPGGQSITAGSFSGNNGGDPGGGGSGGRVSCINILITTLCGSEQAGGSGAAGRIIISYKIALPPNIADIEVPKALCIGDLLYPAIPAPALTTNGAHIQAQGWQKIEEGTDANGETVITKMTDLPVNYKVVSQDSDKKIRYYATNCSGTRYGNAVPIKVNSLPDDPTPAQIFIRPIYNGDVQTASIPNPAGQQVVWYAGSTGSETALAPATKDVSPFVPPAYIAYRNTTTGCISAKRSAVLLRIQRAPLTVTAVNDTKEYDGVAYVGPGKGVTYSGFVSGEHETGDEPIEYKVFFLDGSEVDSNGTSPGTNAGKYLLQAQNLGDYFPNYTITYFSDAANDLGILTVKKAPLTVTACNYSKTYDGRPYTGEMGVVYSGFVNNEFIHPYPDNPGKCLNAAERPAVLGGTLGFALSTEEATDAGEYKITPTGLTSNNYEIIPVDGTLTIEQKNITGSFTVDASKVYDGGDIAHGLTTTLNGIESKMVNGSLVKDEVVLTGVAKYDNKNVDTGKTVTLTEMSLTGKDAGNYKITDAGTTTADITAKQITVTAVTDTKVYDGKISSDKTPGITSYTEPALATGDEVKTLMQTYDTPLVGTGKIMTANVVIDDGNNGGNYRVAYVQNNTGVINARGTVVTPSISAATIRYMDNLTMTAIVKPDNTKVYSSLMSTITGTVMFKIADKTYGPATVVPVPGATDGSVQAMLIAQVTNLPADYLVETAFTSTNSNYLDSYHGSPSLKILQRDAAPADAAGFYTGDLFAWTTNTSSNTATLTLMASVKDKNTEAPGNVQNAYVNFYLVNNGTYTLIAKNRPVGLVDVTDASLGVASAIVQMNTGSLDTCNFTIAIEVLGAYKNDRTAWCSQRMVTISKPMPGGFICGGGCVANSDQLGASSGYLKGYADGVTDYEFDIQYNQSLTNPKGKVKIVIHSYNKADGTLDYPNMHTYVITTNAIAGLNIARPSTDNPAAVGTFNAKANVVESKASGDVSLEGGATFNMVASQDKCNQQISISLLRKAGGVWFSSHWNQSLARTDLKAVTSKSKVYVYGGGDCTKTPVAKSADVAISDSMGSLTFEAIAYPNPTHDNFTLEIENGNDENVNLTLYDMLGREVKRFDLGNAKTFRFGEDLPIGSYIGIITQGENKKTIKLLKN